MAEMDLFDTLNDCVDRINDGESLDECLADYPELASRLRPLLATGLLVYQAQQFANDAAADQEEMRPAVVEAMRRRSRSEAERRRRPRRMFFALAAALSVLVVVGLMSMLFLATRPAGYASEAELTVTYVVAYNSTQSGFVNQTMAASEVALAATRAAVEATGLITVPAIVTATAIPTLGVGAYPTGTLSIPDVNMTATAMTGLFNPLPTPIMGVATFVPTEVGLVPTSVALMSPAPSMTAMPTGTPMPYPTLPPTWTAPPGTPPPTLVPTWSPAPGTPTAPPQVSIVTQIAPTLPPEVQIIPLSAGEIDDNARWDDYLTYRNNYLQQYGYSVHNVDVSGRQIITVTESDGLPVLGARVDVFAGQTQVSESETYATGQTLFFPNASAAGRSAQSYRVVITKDNASAEFTLDPQRGPNWNVTLQNAPPLAAVKLDVLFLLDSTGSMADEIAQLQNNILGISSEIAALPGNVDTRYGLVTYRDRGDEYVTRTYDFTPDVGAFQANLNQVQAGGGGDVPESLNQALHEAVENASWRGDDTVKLIFLVADAPPHLDYPNDYDYAQEMAVAAQRGIKIHPIATSNLPPDGEYIFRQMAEYTMGHFIFLTYQQGTSGAPGDSRTDLHVGQPSEPQNQQQGDYTVQQLDKLVLRLIEDELAALHTRVQSSHGVNLALALGSVPRPGQGMPPPNTPPLTPDFLPATPHPAVFESAPASPLVNWPYLLVIMILAVGLGYALRSRPPARPIARREKRKNDEVSPASLMSLLKADWLDDEGE